MSGARPEPVSTPPRNGRDAVEPSLIVDRRAGKTMSEWRVLLTSAAVAAAAVLGRWIVVPIGPLAVIAIGILTLIAAYKRRSSSLMLLALVIIASGRSQQSEANYVPLAPGPFEGWVELVTDPEPGRFGTTAEAMLPDRSRVRLDAGWDQHRLETLTAGSRAMVSGHIRSIEESDWVRSRHLLGRLSVEGIGATREPAWWRQPSEWMRAGVQRGGQRLDPKWEPLYTGLVVGDDRFQAAGQQARFRAAGLSHLLAVSGQNVAFVLAVAAPLLQRLGWWNRLFATVGLLVVFAVATRLEPSVLRATATAMTSVWAVHTGARASGVRALAIAIIALLLIDPFLVWSLGFRLSVAASLGILVISPVLARRLRARSMRSGVGVLSDGATGAAEPGGAWWRTPLTITVGAQLGVAPLLVAAFGPVALISIPANLAAGWAAGFVMVWGFSGGLVAALVGARLGAMIQTPASVAMWWIDTVATVATTLPSPVIGGGASVAAGAALLLTWLASPVSAMSAWLGRAMAVALLVASVPTAPDRSTELAGGARYWPGGAGNDSFSVLVLSSGADDRLLESVIRLRLGTVDAVVVETGGRTISELVNELRDVIAIGAVLAPPQHRVVGGTRLLEPTEVRVSGTTLQIRPTGDDNLTVEARAHP